MNFIADLHIHSRFSRATSKQLSPRHLAAWARCKGINVLGTGDFTHPQWRDELRRQLVRDEASGLYRLSGPAEELDFLQGKTPPDADGPLFLLQTEISSIYKRQGKVRKVHNLIFVPTLDDADRLSQRLELVGNLHSDGRPILGLDSRDLLEMTLDVCPEAVLIPAHVWTPWFALFGSKSGFDRLEDCFDDLSSHIFALETGLSSDPGMNRMVSQLDGYALISNSDAHSGANLGREANFFAGEPSYDGIFAALRAAARRLPPDRQPQDCRFLGTMEFYPEEGKYHLDGHRACGVVLEPREALALDNICPVCGKPLTIGVLHRVCELADRETPASLLHEPEARPLIPLPELVGEILGVGSGSRKVQDKYAALLRELGPDLDILCRMDEEQVRRHWEPLGEAVSRMRRGQVIRKGGYDGEYGVVRVFSPEEAAEWQGATRSRSLLDGAAPRKRGRPKKVADPAPQAPEQETAATVAAIRVRRKKDSAAPAESEPEPATPDGRTLGGFSPAQAEALTAGLETGTPVLVLAGPGAGKTRVLVGRLQYLLAHDVPASQLLAVTFTRRAAQEMRQRLQAPAGDGAVPAALPRCDTLHALAWSVVQRELPSALLLPEDAAKALFVDAGHPESLEERKSLRRLWERLQWSREQGLSADELPDDLRAAVADWQAARTVRSQSPLLDYADLLEFFLFHLRARQGEDIRPDLEHSLLPPACRALLAAAVTERHHPAQTPAPSPTTSAGPDTTPEHHEAPHKGHAVPRQMSLLGMVAATAAPAPVPAPSRRASALPWRHVLVDEVQDLSPVQLRLIRALLPEDGNGFFGIGDPDRGQPARPLALPARLPSGPELPRQPGRAGHGPEPAAGPRALRRPAGHAPGTGPPASFLRPRPAGRGPLDRGPHPPAAGGHGPYAHGPDRAGRRAGRDPFSGRRGRAGAPQGPDTGHPPRAGAGGHPLRRARAGGLLARSPLRRRAASGHRPRPGRGPCPCQRRRRERRPAAPAGTGAGSGPGRAPARSPGPAGPPFRAQPPARPALAGHGLEAALPCMAGLRPVGGPCAAAGPAT